MNIRNFSSLALVMILLFSLIIPSGVMADGESPAASSEPADVTTPVTVDATVQDPDKTAEYNSVTVTGNTPAVTVSATGQDASADVKITENVSDTTDNSSAKAVDVSSSNGGSASVVIGGDVTASSEASSQSSNDAVGVEVTSSDSTAEMTVNGSVDVSTKGASATAIYTNDQGTSGSTQVTVKENVSVFSETDNSYGYKITQGITTQNSGTNTSTDISVGGNVNAVSIANELGSLEVNGIHTTNGVGSQTTETPSTKITVDGDVTVIADSAGKGDVTAGGVMSNNNGGTVDVSVGGDVNVTAANEHTSSATGVSASAKENAKTTIEIAGTVEVQSSHQLFGVSATATNGGSIDVSVGNGITLTTEGDGRHTGISANSTGESSQVDITVTGDVSLEGNVEHTYKQTKPSASTTPSTEPFYGDNNASITASASNGGIINISIEEGNSISLINNDVTVTEGVETVDSYSYVSGIGASVSELSQNTADGNVTIRVEDTDGNDTYDGEFFDNGNVLGGDVGLQVVLNENSNTEVNVVASGTIMGGNAAVLVNKNVTEDNLSLTVWQIVPTETIDNEEHVVVTKEVTDEGYNVPVSTEQTQKIEQNIQYIIKVEPNANATLTTGGTTAYEGYNVARQGDRVTLKINAADGYYIEGAYNGLGERIPLQYADGVYYIDVPMGGGIYLSARVGRHEEAPEERSTAVRVASKGEGLTAIATMKSSNRPAIPAINRYLKAEERKAMAALPPIQQLLVVMIKAGFGEAAATSGFTISEDAQKLIDSLNVDLRKAVQVIEKYENGVKVKWYTIEMVFPGNQIARVAFRQLEDGTWTIKML